MPSAADSVTNDDRNGPPPRASLEWAAAMVHPRANVAGFRPLTGGLSAAVFQLTIDHPGGTTDVVLRRWSRRRSFQMPIRHVRLEASTLTALASIDGIPAPELLGADPEGEENEGVPTLLMGLVPGRIELAPTPVGVADPDPWVRPLADMLTRIHDVALDVDLPSFEPWWDRAELEVPAWTGHPDRWRRILELVRAAAPPGSGESAFIHGDFQHFNVLRSNGEVTGVVDWTSPASGPPDLDVAHCMLNLAVLYSAAWADRFRQSYEAAAGRRTDPLILLECLTEYDEGWPTFIPDQVDGRTTVDADGMHERVDDLVLTILRRC